MIRSIEELEVAGRRVFVRGDLDVPLGAGGAVADDARLLALLPTLQLLLERRAKVILAGHLGRPGGQAVPALSLEPVGARLAELLGGEVLLADDATGDGVRKLALELREGQLLLLENLGFRPEEAANGEAFARDLAALCDAYVADSVADLKHAWASTAALPRLVRERAAGLLVAAALPRLQAGRRPPELPGLAALET